MGIYTPEGLTGCCNSRIGAGEGFPAVRPSYTVKLAAKTELPANPIQGLIIGHIAGRPAINALGQFRIFGLGDVLRELIGLPFQFPVELGLEVSQPVRSTNSDNIIFTFLIEFFYLFWYAGGAGFSRCLPWGAGRWFSLTGATAPFLLTGESWQSPNP